MTDSVKRFLEKYEWGYPFYDYNDGADTMTIQREIDRVVIRAENKRFYEPISIKKPPEKKKPERRHFLGC